MADTEHPDAFEKALGQLDAMQASAGEDDAVTGDYNAIELHEVTGVGRYAVPALPGLFPLLRALRDSKLELGFSPARFAHFDKPLGSAHPLEMNAALAENIALLRNYLLTLYYTDTPEGMTGEQARQALEETAQLLADGLYADQLGRKPVAGQPHLQRALAGQMNGEGIRYLYGQLHAAYRQQGWLRPFHAVGVMFGGRASSDWRLPMLDDTPFLPLPSSAMSSLQLKADASVVEIDGIINQIDGLEAQQSQAVRQRLIAHAADDLDALGNQLISVADGLQDVSQMSEPVRQDAIDIAREILKKLKITFGEQQVLSGLSVEPEGQDVEELGGIKGVANVFERLLAWARGLDASILQHPTVQAAGIALGQLGYALKLEALRMAKLLGDSAQMHLLSQQMGSVPRHYTHFEEEEFAVLLYRVEQGIDTVLNRVQEINGPAAAVGHSASKELGSYMQGTPIAGTALQTSEAVTNRNAAQQRMAAQQRESAQRAQVQRMTQQLASRSGGGAAPAARGSASAQLNALRQRLQQLRAAAQRMSAVRAANIHGHDEEHPHGAPPAPGGNVHGHPPDPIAATMAKIDPRLINNIRAMASSTAGLTTNPVLTGKAAFQKMQQATTQGIQQAKAKASDENRHHNEEENRHIMEEEQLHKPQGPGKGGGRGM